jgi:hypothetical protein
LEELPRIDERASIGIGASLKFSIIDTEATGLEELIESAAQYAGNLFKGSNGDVSVALLDL